MESLQGFHPVFFAGVWKSVRKMDSASTQTSRVDEVEKYRIYQRMSLGSFSRDTAVKLFGDKKYNPVVGSIKKPRRY